MKKLVILDTFAVLHRAWHAIPPLTNKQGVMTNAVYGFTSILLKIIKELEPDYLVAAFDLPHETFRKKAYPEYKAQREAPDKDFIGQIVWVEKILSALNIPKLALAGYEADDIIGSLATQVHGNKDIRTIIVSGDLDTLQLVNNRTEVYTMRQGFQDTLTYDAQAIKDRYGLEPQQLIDMKALRGDPSDNIPGVKGIGEKGAAGLIQTFGSLVGVYKHLDSPKIKPRMREILTTQEEQAFLSKKLVTIVCDLKVNLDLKKAETDNYDWGKAKEVFQELDFHSLMNKLPTSNGGQRSKSPSQHKAILAEDYWIVDSEAAMKKLADRLKEQKIIALDTETTGLDALEAEILGASFSWGQAQAAFVHLRDIAARKNFTKHLKPALENAAIKKIGHNLKYDYQVLATIGIKLEGLHFDTLIAAYLLKPDRGLKLEELAFSYLGVTKKSLQELSGSDKKTVDVAGIEPAALAMYGAADADLTWRLAERLRAELKEEKMDKLLADIEVPLIPILASMERQGILLDVPFLKKLEKEFKGEIKELERKIYHLAGQKFNIASPLQLKEILFEKLAIDITGIKKKKTGLSTAASELEKLRGRHPIIDMISDYRELAKLVNTYVAALPDLLSPSDQRLHTSFNQTIAATGRLSSSNPNLQNIPIRTPLGRQVRQAFIAPKGAMLLSADYSQIELRLAAVLSKDPKMTASFKAGEDIHRRTAAEIHGVSLEEVTPDQRRKAKEVNFGVIYGLGSTGLAQRTGISRLEAKQFIEQYFNLFKGLKRYIEDTKQQAHEQGYVETLFGRRRHLPEIYSSLPQLIAQAERMAVNMPLQGTAADLMKLAMIKCYSALPEIAPTAKMLLQVHDELVFEVAAAEVEVAARAIKDIMESVADFSVPLSTDVKVGDNWQDMKPLTL